MSKENLVEWFEKLLFGSPDFYPPLTTELYLLVTRLETDSGIDIKQIMKNGGFANLLGTINKDLQEIIRYVCDGGGPHFYTPTVSSFFNSLSFIAGHNLSGAFLKSHTTTTTVDESSKITPTTTVDDSDWKILDLIIKNEDGNKRLEYKDARFWGDLARQLLHLQRPFKLSEIQTDPMFVDAIRLYDHTCKSLGRLVDPFSMVMVPKEGYVDAVHWQTPEIFRQFLKNSSSSSVSSGSGNKKLATTVKSVVMDSILEARYKDLPKEWQLRSFLRNVHRVHQTISSVEGNDVPPILIDAFQRLLTKAGKDDLWETNDSSPIVVQDEDEDGATYLALYKRVLELERASKSSSD